MNNILQNKKFLLIAIISLFILLIIILAFIFLKPSENILIIDNMDSHIDNLPKNRKNYIQTTLYSYITKQNDINNIENKKEYHGTIRTDSFSISNLEIEEENIYSASFILDIPELKYSYQTEFSWTEEPSPNNYTDLGSVSIYCLSEEDSIYPDFNCNQNPLISIKVDPLLSINFIIDEYCWMSPFSSVESKSGYGIDIFYHPTDADYKNDTIESSYNNCIKTTKQYLTSQNIILSNYKIRSQIKYFYNY